jgi:hypothetical protein
MARENKMHAQKEAFSELELRTSAKSENLIVPAEFAAKICSAKRNAGMGSSQRASTEKEALTSGYRIANFLRLWESKIIRPDEILIVAESDKRPTERRTVDLTFTPMFVNKQDGYTIRFDGCSVSIPLGSKLINKLNTHADPGAFNLPDNLTFYLAVKVLAGVTDGLSHYVIESARDMSNSEVDSYSFKFVRRRRRDGKS